MLIGYIRVSKSDGTQTLEPQRDALLAAGIDPSRIYEDMASGRHDARPGLTACLKALQPGNTLVIWKLDRLGRDLRHLVTTAEDLRSRGIGLKGLAGAGAQIDTTSANGRLAFGIFATFAEFERELIAERTHAGLAAARARGRMGGRPRKLIAMIYEVETDIRQCALGGEAKRPQRLTHAKPRVEAFFGWVGDQLARQGLLPSNLLTKALVYARERRVELMVCLGDAEVPMDTNHLERALRPIPMGRRNWLFCWTEVGARHAGIVQSLIATCRLHGVEPYTYLVDVLQRVGQHPAARVAELTPRLWKQHFAEQPLRSDLHGAMA